MEWTPNRLYFGADYNPEQWPRESWSSDIRQMQDLGVNMVTLGVFSWALLEPREGMYEFGWLDEIVELLHDGGIRIDMATATASTPAWLTEAYPSVAAINREGVRLAHGGRQHYSPSSQVYREKSLQLVEQMASRYAKHPALEMWHVNNELGCHTPHCYGDEAAERFRQWLKKRYASVEQLNARWHTKFWSQNYGSFEEVNPPRLTAAGTFSNPGHFQDFMHFSSDQLLELFVGERDTIRRIDDTHPITTNFMSMRHISAMDYWKWAREVDFISTDHYAEADNPDAHVELAFEADLTRGFAGGKPWLLMEHSPAAVNWQPRNAPKDSDEILRHAMSHIARGSNGVMFFQFKQSQGGSERFHTAMVPHIGEDSRVYRSMKELGSRVAELDALSSRATAPAEVAMVLDYHSWWALQQPNLPSVDLDYPNTLHSWYATAHDLGISVDFIDPDSPLDRWRKYKAVLLPMLHIVDEARFTTIDAYVEGGGHILTSFFSGVADSSLAVHLGGYGGSLLSTTCGVRVEEFVPLREGESLELSNGWSASLWSEKAEPLTAEVIARYSTSGVSSSSAAVSKNTRGSGEAWYVGTQLDRDSQLVLMEQFVAPLSIERDGNSLLELVRRGDQRVVINHARESADCNGVEVPGGAVTWR